MHSLTLFHLRPSTLASHFSIIMFSQANPGKGGDNLTMGATAIAGLGFAAPLVFLIAVVQLCARECVQKEALA